MPKFKEEWKTMHNVFDQFTERNLFKLSSQGFFDKLLSQVSMGKEANIFSCSKGDSYRIIKIYRLQNCDFKKMYQYIKYDPRFPSLTNRRRKVIFSWAQREFRNLMKAREAGVRVPTPYTCLFNILVMEFVGDDQPALRLKDNPPKNPKKFLNNLLEEMRRLYKADLIHGDLSAYNILNHNESPVIIDMSQSTPKNNPFASEYFERDYKNIAKFFSKLGVETSYEKIMEFIRK